MSLLPVSEAEKRLKALEDAAVKEAQTYIELWRETTSSRHLELACAAARKADELSYLILIMKGEYP